MIKKVLFNSETKQKFKVFLLANFKLLNGFYDYAVRNKIEKTYIKIIPYY